MITMLRFCCKGCANFVSFETVDPKSTMTEDMLKSMGFTIIEREGKKEYYCPKCKNKVPKEYVEDDLAYYRLSNHRPPMTAWEKDALKMSRQTDQAPKGGAAEIWDGEDEEYVPVKEKFVPRGYQ